MIKYWTRLTATLAWLAVVYLSFPPRAHAYLDPGSGSYVLQLVIAALLGAALTIKLYWKRIKALMSDLFSNRARGTEEDD